MTSREAAERLLIHYIGIVWRKVGLTFDGDNESELRELVDEIIRAARDEESESEGGEA